MLIVDLLVIIKKIKNKKIPYFSPQVIYLSSTILNTTVIISLKNLTVFKINMFCVICYVKTELH